MDGGLPLADFHWPETGREFRFPTPSKELEGNDEEVSLTLLEANPADFPGSDSGAVLWDSAEVLARFLCARGSRALLCEGGRLGAPTVATGAALELGTGCGLVAMALAALGIEVLATDGQPRVVHGVAALNVAANREALRAPVHLQVLGWDDEVDDEQLRELILRPLQHHSGLNLIVGSDILYDVAGRKALAALLLRLVGLQSLDGLKVLLSWQVRHPQAEEKFFSSLSDAFTVEVLHEEPVTDLFSDDGASVVKIAQMTPIVPS